VNFFLTLFAMGVGYYVHDALDSWGRWAINAINPKRFGWTDVVSIGIGMLHVAMFHAIGFAVLRSVGLLP
jgi:hypothetical protein